MHPKTRRQARESSLLGADPAHQQPPTLAPSALACSGAAPRILAGGRGPREGGVRSCGGNRAPQRPTVQHAPARGRRGRLPGLQRLSGRQGSQASCRVPGAATACEHCPRGSRSVPPAALRGQGGAVDGRWGEPRTGGGESRRSQSVLPAGRSQGHARCWSGTGLCCPLGKDSESHMGPCPGLGGGGPASTWENARLAREHQDGATGRPSLCLVATSPMCRVLLPEPRTGRWRHRARLRLGSYFLTRIFSRKPQSRKPEIHDRQHCDPTHGPHAHLTHCAVVCYGYGGDPTGHLPPTSLQALVGHMLRGAGPF